MEHALIHSRRVVAARGEDEEAARVGPGLGTTRKK